MNSVDVSSSKYFIDPPASWDQLSDWEEFLFSLLKADQRDPGIRKHIAEARDEISAARSAVRIAREACREVPS
ncbi:hypothetical protein [Rhizobium sp.]